MTMLGVDGTTIGVTPLCGALKPRTRIPCMRIGVDHKDDHGNDYVGERGVTWPRASGEKR